MAIPVYMFAGFLESGKTSFIASVLQDPGFTRDESTLIIQCEEGETEYEPDMLKKTHSVVECIEDEDEYNGDTLRAFVRKHHPDRVIVEMNGMWDLDAAIERTPKVLEIYQIITTVNAETFDLYAKNMGQRMLQHITDADMVVFNRATEETRQLIRDRNVRSMNPQASLYFENDDGTSEDYGAGMPPPYDMDAPIVEIEDHQFGIFYLDASENPEEYDGKTVRFKGYIYRGRNIGKDGHGLLRGGRALRRLYRQGGRAADAQAEDVADDYRRGEGRGADAVQGRRPGALRHQARAVRTAGGRGRHV